MDYRRHYNLLMERAKIRNLSGYTEQHHIVPRCMGGSDEKDNLVLLTAEEHFVAHQLLVKMYPDHLGLLWAISAMRHATDRMVRNNKMYGWLRRRFAAMLSKMMTGRTMSPESRAKMSAAKLGKKRAPHSPETKAKMSAASKGKPKSPEHIAALSLARTGKKLGPHSEETKRKISESNKKTWSERDKSFFSDPEYRSKQSENMKRVWAERKSNQ
jgi:hypothetical protein